MGTTDIDKSDRYRLLSFRMSLPISRRPSSSTLRSALTSSSLTHSHTHRMALLRLTPRLVQTGHHLRHPPLLRHPPNRRLPHAPIQLYLLCPPYYSGCGLLDGVEWVGYQSGSCGRGGRGASFDAGVAWVSFEGGSPEGEGQGTDDWLVLPHSSPQFGEYEKGTPSYREC